MSKCPNCAGEMEADFVRKIQICPYCETELFFSADMGRSIQSNTFLTSELFVIKNTDFNVSGKETWEVLCSSLNSGKNSDQLKEDMIQLANDKEECATLTWNQELGNKAVKKIAYAMRQDEKYIFYKDSGFFPKAKEGILITDQRIFFLKKKQVQFLYFPSIRALRKSTIGGHWYFDGNLTCVIDTIGCTNIELGKILAYICMRTYEMRQEGHRIVIDKQ